MQIAFTPTPLNGWHKLYHAKIAGLFTESSVDDADIVFNWNTESVKTAPLIIAGKRVVNADCCDVSKQNVERVFRHVYGYGTAPTSDMAVVKNSTNQGKKDAVLMPYNGEQKEGFVYQMPLFDAGAHIITESRTIIMSYLPVMRIIKHKRISADNICGTVVSAEIAPLLTDDRLPLFCDLLGFEFGEIDMIEYGGRWYIIDANNIAGDALFFDKNIGERVKQEYFSIFAKMYL